MAGTKNLDYIETQADNVESLMNNGKSAEALAAIQALKPWIQGEKRKS